MIISSFLSRLTRFSVCCGLIIGLFAQGIGFHTHVLRVAQAQETIDIAVTTPEQSFWIQLMHLLLPAQEEISFWQHPLLFLLEYGIRSRGGEEVNTPGISQERAVSFGHNLEQFIPQEPVALSIWMLADSAAVYEQDFADFERSFPHITLEHVSFRDERIYMDELRKAFARNDEPDVFLVNEELFQEFLQNDELAPAPSAILLPSQIAEYFYPLAAYFVRDYEVFAAPLFGQFLVMFSNQVLLSDDRIFVAQKPGKTWAEIAANLKNFQEFGDIRTVLPFGLGDPVFAPFTFDVFLLLLLQADVQSFEEKAAGDAIHFLHTFRGGEQTRNLPTSAVEAFLQGKTAVLFGDEGTYQQLLAGIRTAAQRSSRRGALQEEDIQIDLLPQFRPDQPKTLGKIWGFSIAKSSSYPDFSWAIATSLITKDEARQHFLRTQKTALLQSIPNHIFSESAAMAVSAGSWQDLDFRDIFAQNMRALEEETNLSIEILLQRFADFFRN